jgi:oligoribonuclease
MKNSQRNKKYLIWMDCEMTGLDPAKHVLLEIATIVTNYDLEIIARGPVLAIRASKARMQAMDSWPRRTHKASGLLDRIRKEGVSTASAERQTLNFLKKYCSPGSSPLCGNTIGQDKRFLAKYMPELHNFMNYRVIDVSSIKMLVAEWYGGKYDPPKKKEAHRALLDIEESIAELDHYRKTVFVKEIPSK